MHSFGFYHTTPLGTKVRVVQRFCKFYSHALEALIKAHMPPSKLKKGSGTDKGAGSVGQTNHVSDVISQ